MSRSSEQKIRLLVLYDILRKESDEDSPLSTNELIEKLSQYGITATRQTVYDDIDMLNTFGYEIICVHGRNNRYFVGDRKFELPEVQILLYAVGASKFLTEKKGNCTHGKDSRVTWKYSSKSSKRTTYNKRWGIRKRADLLQHK